MVRPKSVLQIQWHSRVGSLSEEKTLWQELIQRASWWFGRWSFRLVLLCAVVLSSLLRSMGTLPLQLGLPIVKGPEAARGYQRQERSTCGRPAHCSVSQQPEKVKRSKSRPAGGRPPAPCQSTAGSLSWMDVAEFTPVASEANARSPGESVRPLEQPAVWQQQQQKSANNASVLRINVDLGLVRFRFKRTLLLLE